MRGGAVGRAGREAESGWGGKREAGGGGKREAGDGRRVGRNVGQTVTESGSTTGAQGSVCSTPVKRKNRSNGHR